MERTGQLRRKSQRKPGHQDLMSLKDGQTLCRNRQNLSKTSESFSKTDADIDFPFLESSQTAIQQKSRHHENDLLPEVNNDSAQTYLQQFHTSVKPPTRNGIKDGQ